MLIRSCLCLSKQVRPYTSIPVVGMNVTACIDAHMLSMADAARSYNFPIGGKHDPGIGSKVKVGFVPLGQQVVKGGLHFSVLLNFTYSGKPDDSFSIVHNGMACHKAT